MTTCRYRGRITAAVPASSFVRCFGRVDCRKTGRFQRPARQHPVIAAFGQPCSTEGGGAHSSQEPRQVHRSDPRITITCVSVVNPTVMMVQWVVRGGLTLNSTGRGALVLVSRLLGTALGASRLRQPGIGAAPLAGGLRGAGGGRSGSHRQLRCGASLVIARGRSAGGEGKPTGSSARHDPLHRFTCRPMPPAPPLTMRSIERRSPN